MLNAVRFNQIPSNAGLGLEMKVIAAVVVGGASVTGGSGTCAGTVLGVDPARADRAGAHVSRRERLLGARDPGRRSSWSRSRLTALRHAALRRVSGVARPRASVDHAWRKRWFPNGEWVLLLVLAVEILFFSAIAPNFFTLGNFFEMTRFSVELGLLAVALTPVIITGGIDLSVGSMMGLAAVRFGAAITRWQLPLPLAAASRGARRPAPAAR